MTDKSIEATVAAIDRYGATDWVKPLQPAEVRMECPCGQPITVRLRGTVRELSPGPNDPAAELISLTTDVEHHGECRGNGALIYVIKSAEPQLHDLERPEGEQEPGEQDQPA